MVACGRGFVWWKREPLVAEKGCFVVVVVVAVVVVFVAVVELLDVDSE